MTARGLCPRPRLARRRLHRGPSAIEREAKMDTNTEEHQHARSPALVGECNSLHRKILLRHPVPSLLGTQRSVQQLFIPVMGDRQPVLKQCAISDLQVTFLSFADPLGSTTSDRTSAPASI